HQGVAGVVAALVAHHRGGLIGQQVDDLALALITPLGTQDDDVLAHNTCPLRTLGSRRAGGKSLRSSAPRPATGRRGSPVGGRSRPRWPLARPVPAAPERRARRLRAGAERPA